MKLNSVATFDSYPMPRTEEMFETVEGARIMTTLDLANGYWQIPLDQSAREKTAFATSDGLYKFEVMPFGLHSAPATFQWMVNTVLRSCFQFAQAYIVIFSQNWKELLYHLEEVLECLWDANLTVQLGHVIGQGKVLPDKKIRAVQCYPRPSTKKEVRAFLGLTGDDQMEHPVAFTSRRLLLLETRYFTVEKECLAIVWALNYFKIYLLGQQFVIETDHKPLSWLHRMKNNNARLMRWTLQIQSYRFDLKYRRGSLNANADGLSQAGKNERMMSDSAVPDPPPSS
uniref:Reverse transcriptase RNase H-like domain-containing protein n=1 Tax=Amphimedon queenslandica TaxID=400682 RepID=A0A1X7T409_AMPQE